MEYFHAPFKFSGYDSHKGDSVTVSRVHVGLNFKNEGREERIKGMDGSLIGISFQWSLCQLEEMFQEGFYTEVGQGRTKEDRRQFPFGNGFEIEIIAGDVHQFDVFFELIQLMRRDMGPLCLIVQINDFGIGFLGSVLSAGEQEDSFRFTFIHAGKFLAGTQGPVHGIGPDAEDILDFLHQLKGIPGFPVHFIDKGKNRDSPQGTDLEQLLRLFLHAFGSVNDHDR
ncbi:hypothetical protein DSECCO2_333960 [anaerobic digester metagenome]